MLDKTLLDDRLKDTHEPVAELAITMPRLIALATADQPTIPQRYVGKPRDMVTAIWMGREIGLAPMESIMSIYLVNGAAALSGKVMSALIHRAGHIIKVTSEVDGAEVVCCRWHAPSGELVEVGTVTFTAEDAKRAGLTPKSKPTYGQYPQMMLTWRAVSFAARLYYADVISGLGYVPEEIGVDVQDYETLPDEVVDAEIVQPLSDDTMAALPVEEEDDDGEEEEFVYSGADVILDTQPYGDRGDR